MMESPRMYEEGLPDSDFVQKLNHPVFIFRDEIQQSDTLDPTLENVVDLHELIALESGEGPLILDNYLSSSDLDIVEGHIPASTNSDFLDISKFVPETVQKVCMTNPDEVTSTTNGRPILTIKSEDLGFADCHAASLPLSPVHSEVDSRSCWSPASTTSSRSSRSSKEPLVYECRKPGRKPSANGPIRPRKREPPKNTTEYFDKRARNNVAVRKSREKAKLRQGETETRVNQLTNENERLQKKVDLLSKELNVLKSLFINVGSALPENFEELLSR
ncbi:CCAAT/enhancer-binding protein delta-like [Mya arenaria]|uniref:CCAAT/enhancer-binding protein delta-like n=1 Tax=Mya arenaria TaxID=6604 RepID=UPI0022E16844|nr:CCAAT/enhancer-binding protein delta-like [Mya arenaria]